ncbi:MAG: GNAT family N-acetyltransferase [Chloroflexota bacterium]
MATTIEEAHVGDASQITACVSSAYQKYISVIGKLPEPALDNYVNIINEHAVWVMRRGKRVVGVIVLMEKEGELLLDNVAIHPSEQHQGLGRELIAFAEAEAKERGYDAIHLYTHEKMRSNLALYESLGYEETKRISERGYDRVYMRKQL